MKLLVKSGSIVDPAGVHKGVKDILIVDGIINRIEDCIEEAVDEVIDAKGLHVFPGLIDLHTHLRQPGFEKKETVKSGTMAAAKGGYTTVCCMPNTNPVIDNINSLELLKGIIAKDAVVKVLPIAAITVEQGSKKLADLRSLKAAGAIAFSDDGKPVANNRIMRDALRLSKENGYIIIDHCEDMELAGDGVINEGMKSRELGLKGIPGLSEELPIMRDVLLAEETGAAVHIAHISTAKSAEILGWAKSRGIKVTCEVTPHHLALNEDMIEKGFTDCKVNPPLRTKQDVEALKKALAEDVIDAIATDHAPHHKEDKGADFYKAANGISGIETSFMVCYTELVDSGFISFEKLIDKMSRKPAELLGIEGGELRAGCAADLAIADISKVIRIDKDRMVSLGKNTPFHGRSYKGEIKYTLVNGKVVFNAQ